MNVFNVYPRFNISLTKGKGVFVYDEHNRPYLDLYGGHGVISIGHSHPHYVEALTKQLQSIGFYSNSIEIPLQQELATKLGALSGCENYNLFLCSTGAEANENAIKVASFHTGRKKVIAFKGSFHGRTATALNITDNPKISAPVNKNNFPVDFIELNNEEDLIASLKTNDVCAVIIEPLQGVGGLAAPTTEYLQFLERNCKKYGAMLILDEIQSGCGRSGKFFAHQHAGIQADIVCIAKGMGNGFPVAGVLIHEDIEAKMGMLGTTFGGSQLACVAAISVLDVIDEEDLIENAARVSAAAIDEFNGITSVKEVKGMGLMLGVEFDFPIKELRNKLLFEHHIFTGACANPNLLRILPPLNITFDQIQAFSNAIQKILK